MIEIEASTIGPEIVQLIDSGEGRVLAVLSNSLYLESSLGYVAAIVGEQAVDGPLSLRVRDLPRLLEALRGQQNRPFRVLPQCIQIGTVAEVSLRNASQWVPRLPDRLGHQPARNQAAHRLAEAIAGCAECAPSGRASSLGLSDLVRNCYLEDGEEPEIQAWRNYDLRFFAALRTTVERWPFESRRSEPAERVLKRFADGILRFTDAWQDGDSIASAGSLIALMGLGEGLTPSGDDLVSGILAALVWQARLKGDPAPSVEQLRDRILEGVPRTNRISARLHHYASTGVLYAPAMALGAALLAGDAQAVREPAHDLFSIGNTSGVDVATGLLVGCLAAERITG